MTESYFLTKEEAAQAVVTTILGCMDESDRTFYIALSGGSSPDVLFKVWQRDYHSYTDWNRIRFFWVDERCVPPTSDQSNFKLAYDLLLSKVDIPSNNYYRILGEAPPFETAIMYSSLVKSLVKSYDGIPQFDFVLLGIGEDGHTSSIFLDNMGVLKSHNLYEVMKNPYDDTLRVGMTGSMMIKALNTIFFVIGEKKHDITRQILKKENVDLYPASYVWNKADNSQIFASFVK